MINSTGSLFAPSPALPDIQLHSMLLGSPQLQLADQPVTLPRRQMRALWYRLATDLQPLPRDQLCFLLWPDIPEMAARRHLTVLLNQLRNTLPIGDIVLTQSDAILLNPALISADTVMFASALASALHQGALDQLADAALLYRGPFLDGFALPASAEFDAWASQERQAWERRYLDALAALVDGYAARRDYQRAIDAAQRALAVDGLAEDMHRWLIALYATLNDRASALRQFERCVMALDRELGVSPLPETRAMYEAVLAGTFNIEHEALRINQDSTPHPLSPIPTAPTPLIGRQTDLTTTCTLLRNPAVRLLTLYGPGGSGKTRLAIQAAADLADQFADGVVFVAFAALRDAALVLPTIATSCGLKQTGAAALTSYLRDKQLLLVLDNCEHVLDAGPELAGLLDAAPGLRVLATSRAALGLNGEQTVLVPPLPLPDLAHLPALADLAAVPSVALLLARAHALNPAFQLTDDNAAQIAAICVRLDGLPLAIELAAARLKLLSPRDVLRRLDHRLALLTTGARDLPERQQTLRATIDWSYRLLDAAEQRLFAQLAVFTGSWTLEAAERVCAAPGASYSFAAATNVPNSLATLADKSLLQQVVANDGPPRFSMLETIREYAAEQLELRGAFDAAAQAHADCYLALVEPMDVNTPAWLSSIERELDNLRTALRWQLGHADMIEAALRLGLVLGRFFYWRDWLTEGRWWLEQIVTHSASFRTEARANMLAWTALLATVQGDTARATELHETNLQLCQELQLGVPRAKSLLALGTIYARQGDFPRAIAYLELSLELARELGHPDSLGSACYMLAGVLVDQGRDIARALTLYEECLMIARQHQMVIVESMTLAALGIALALIGDLAGAAALLPEALRMQREMNATMAISWTLQYMGMLSYLQADYSSAQQYLIESLVIPAQGGTQYIAPSSLEGLAGVASARLQPKRAARLLGAAEALRETIELPVPPIEQAHHNHILTNLRGQLSAAALHQAWQAGRLLTLEQAIAEASTLAPVEIDQNT